MDRRWLFAGQLGPHVLDARNQPVLIAASRAALRRRPAHRRRAHLVLSAARPTTFGTITQSQVVAQEHRRGARAP